MPQCTRPQTPELFDSAYKMLILQRVIEFIFSHSTGFVASIIINQLSKQLRQPAILRRAIIYAKEDDDDKRRSNNVHDTAKIQSLVQHLSNLLMRTPNFVHLTQRIQALNQTKNPSDVNSTVLLTRLKSTLGELRIVICDDHEHHLFHSIIWQWTHSPNAQSTSKLNSIAEPTLQEGCKNWSRGRGIPTREEIPHSYFPTTSAYRWVRLQCEPCRSSSGNWLKANGFNPIESLNHLIQVHIMPSNTSNINNVPQPSSQSHNSDKYQNQDPIKETTKSANKTQCADKPNHTQTSSTSIRASETDISAPLQFNGNDDNDNPNKPSASSDKSLPTNDRGKPKPKSNKPTSEPKSEV